MYCVLEGPAINPIIHDGEEPLPSLSDWHDYEPNLEFDDTELTHPATTNGKYTINSHLSLFIVAVTSWLRNMAFPLALSVPIMFHFYFADILTFPRNVFSSCASTDAQPLISVCVFTVSLCRSFTANKMCVFFFF